MKIYVVTEGAYSDYRIVAVCTSEESAKRIQSLENSDEGFVNDARIEEYESDVYNISPTYNIYDVCIYKDGDIEAREADYVYDMHQVEDYTNAQKSRMKYRVRVFASDGKHAKKIALDTIAQYKAEREGL